MTTPLDHPSEELLASLANGELEGGRRDQVAAHIASCERCSAEVSAFRQLAESLASLPRAVDRPPSLPDGFWRTPRLARPWVAGWKVAGIAALLPIGFAIGRATGDPGQGDRDRPVTYQMAALQAQFAGTEYIAALELMHRTSASTAIDRKAVGLEVAASTLYGAARELALLLGEDQGADLVAAAAAVKARVQGRSP